MVIAVIAISLFLLYSILIFYFWQSWRSIPEQDDASIGKGPMLSVVVPARNEEPNIQRLLTALDAQDYPSQLYEVIVIDDASLDNTGEIVSRHTGVKLLRLSETNINSGKKRAIAAGIAAARGEYIVTTDADCLPPSTWLSALAGKIATSKAIFLAAPVAIDANDTSVQVFQAMDFMVLQGITGAGVSKGTLNMCNGANLAYSRTAFFEVKGFEGVDHIASGDDMLLMQKFSRKYPGRIHYLKSGKAIVTTTAVPGWKAFFSQRIRWASKATAYDDRRITLVLLLVYLFNLAFPVLLIAGFWNWTNWIVLLSLLLLKTAVELPFFANLAEFFHLRRLVRLFPVYQPLHIAYTLSAGFLGQFGKYEWKGRRVK